MSINRWMDKVVVHIHHGINSAIKRNAFESVLMRWMKLEPIIQSEVRKRNISITYWHIYRESEREHWWIYFQGSNGETDIENRPMNKMGREEREREMYGESNTEIYNTMCKIDSQWEFAVWLRELKQGLCDSLKSGVGIEMGGRSGREGTWV